MVVQYKTEKDLIIEKLWEIVLREAKVEDGSGIGIYNLKKTNIIVRGGLDWSVSDDLEVARLICAIKILEGNFAVIRIGEESTDDERD